MSSTDLKINRTRSETLFERARKVIPGGVNSPVRAFRSVGGTPLFMRSGAGCRLTDVDGNEFIDFCNSWGPLINGHRHPEILAALTEQAGRSLTFGTPCEEEVLLAEYIIENLKGRVASAEKIRFVNSGTEAVMSALRLARGFTGRSKFIKFDGCYHGHADALLVKAGSGLATLGAPDSAGVPESFTRDTIVLPLHDRAGVEKAFAEYGKDIAAIIIEPIPANNGLLIQPTEFLKFLREISEQHKSLLIFDEVINGFRVGFGGAAELYGIEPDLMTYGKIIGGGLPVGAFCGRSEIFEQIAPDGPVYQAGTLSGNPMAMAAGLAQMKLLNDELYNHLESLGALLEKEINAAGLSWRIARQGSIFWFYKAQGDSSAPTRADQIQRSAMSKYADFHAHCLARGIYLAPSGYEVGFISAPMNTPEIKALAEATREFFS